MILGAAIGLVLGGSQALSRSLFSQLIPAGKEGEYFGFYEISDKGTSWLGPLAVRPGVPAHQLLPGGPSSQPGVLLRRFCGCSRAHAPRLAAGAAPILAAGNAPAGAPVTVGWLTDRDRRVAARPAWPSAAGRVAGCPRARHRRRRRTCAVLLGADGLRQVHDGAADGPQPRPAGPARPGAHPERPLGGPQITTRIGLGRDGDRGRPRPTCGCWSATAGPPGDRVDYLICDEAQFLTGEQVEQIAELVDEYDVDVYAFGLATDFRSRLFPAAQRLFELADEVQQVQVEVLCWCGRPGLLNARVVDGGVVREGETVVIGDTAPARLPGEDARLPADVRYQVLCRRHHVRGQLGPTPAGPGQLALP